MKLQAFAVLAASASMAHGAALERRACAANNCNRQLKDNSVSALSFCATYTTVVHTETTGLPAYVSQCSNSPSRISSACSCLATASTTVPTSSTTTTPSTTAPTSTPTAAGCAPGNNCYRGLAGAGTAASAFCATYTTTVNTATTGLPSFVAKCSAGPSAISSACSCFAPAASTTAPPDSGTSIIGSTAATEFVGEATVTYADDNPPATPDPPQPTFRPNPLHIGAVDGTEGTPAAVNAGPVKKLLSGLNNGDGTYLLAVVSVTGKAGKPLINLLDFASFLTAATCSSPTAISLQFNSADAYNAAKASWVPGMGGITAGAALCGAEGSAHTFFVLDAVSFSDGDRKAALVITQVGVSDVASTTKVEFGSLAPGGSSPAAPEVGSAVAPYWGKITAALSAPVKRADGSVQIHFTPDDLRGDLAFLFGHFPGVEALGGVVECQKCGLFGTLTLSGGVEINWDSLTGSAYAGMDIADLSINMDWLLSISGSKHFNKEFVLASVPAYLVPHIQIGDLIDFGPNIDLVAGIDITTTGTFQVSNLGFTFPPASAGWRVGTAGSSSYGWDALKAPVARDPDWSHTEGALSVKAYIGPKISLNLKVKDPFHIALIPDLDWSAYVEAQFPEVTANFIRPSVGGKCYDPNRSSVEVQVNAGADLVAGVKGLGVDKFVSVWNPEFPIYGTCKVFG